MNAAIAVELFEQGAVMAGSEEGKPSGRISNRMDADTKLIHSRLERWGSWSRDSGIHAWPQATLLARIMDEGPHGAFASSKPPIHMPDDVAHVDAAVARLGDVDRRVIRRYYIDSGPVESMAKDLRMRVREFHNVLKRARWRVSGYLLAIEEI